ncbi:MAG: hypothetical protein CMP65_01320 [Flavobacteriales bacterium]|nr:hypothetical protein [Flavobacteriales bacterium]|tara:strand:+ start:5726 stop:6826 length:1101 start_codon:yes stop_codon:yes gene_type:complete
MKRINLICTLCLVCLVSLAQENTKVNQSTYSQEGTMIGNNPSNTIFNGFEQAKSANYYNSDVASDAISHRKKAIWADNSTIITDEKMGFHSYIPYTYVSEDDVLWAKRVRKWIDVRILQNHPLYFPVGVSYSDYNGWDGTNMESGVGGQKVFNEVLSGIDARKNLFQILRDAATTVNPQTGQPLVATYNMSLTRKLSPQEVVPNWDSGYPNAFGFAQSIEADDEDAEEIDVYYWYEPNHVRGYWIEEEIFFDKRRSKLDFRYVSITPQVQHPREGKVRDLPTFYFPEIRELLANHKVFPLDGNLAQRMSFDEFFHRKMFASVIKKETNVYDRLIQDYLPGRSLEQLLEGERIREQIRRYESDMWNY